MINRLNRLNRAELAALSDREQRLSPNPVHLASALLKLADDNDDNYPRRARRWYR